MRKSLVFIFVVTLLLVSAQTVFANHRSRVLGTSDTSTSALTIPPTTQGPGFILPDSPFYFLDELKQNVRLALAFSPEAKAKVYTNIAGERFAELRYMLQKDNKEGAETALTAVSKNLQKASSELSQAQFSGKDVSALAKTINTDIKDKQQILDELEEDSTGDTKTKIKVAASSLMESKIIVEDSLPQDELENEIREDINRTLEKQLKEVSATSESIDNLLGEFVKDANNSATNSLNRREQALRKAIGDKNVELKMELEKDLAIDKIKQEELLKVSDKAALQAKKAITEAQLAAKEFGQAKKATEQIKKELKMVNPESAGNYNGQTGIKAPVNTQILPQNGSTLQTGSTITNTSPAGTTTSTTTTTNSSATNPTTTGN